MARGSVAKSNAVEIMKKAFGDAWLGESANKFYIEADDGGEKVQLAIALTCPKNPVALNTPVVAGGFDFSQTEVAQTKFEAVDFTDAERENINRLIEKFNL